MREQTKKREKRTMKKALCIAAVLSLAAPSAFAQSRTDIVFAPTAGDAPEIAAVAGAVRKELERSRQLEPLYVDDDTKARLTVPTGLTKDAAGANTTVKYQVKTSRRFSQEQEVTCAVAKVADCGR